MLWEPIIPISIDCKNLHKTFLMDSTTRKTAVLKALFYLLRYLSSLERITIFDIL